LIGWTANRKANNMREDPQLYDYWAYQNRPKIEWPNGARVAFWVAPNIEFYELDPPANPHRKPWPQASPAVSGYSVRDYGNRVGHIRQMELLDKYGTRGSISLITQKSLTCAPSAIGNFSVTASTILAIPMVSQNNKNER